MAVEKNPWFVAKDIAQALGYVWCGKVMDHIPPEWKAMGSVPTPSGTQRTLTISEEGLYFFLNRSDKPAAIPFQKWVAGTVLPSIRKHGGYMPQGKDESPEKIMASHR
jgi:prophage antirepressor-like protein